MNVNLTDWDELASYFDKSTPPGMIYEDGKLLGFGFSKDDYADLIYLDKHGSWHCRGNWQLDVEAINLMQVMTSEQQYATFERLGDSLKEVPGAAHLCLTEKEAELACEIVGTRSNWMDISDDGDLSIRMNDDHTGWIVDESTDPNCHGYLSKRALRLMLEMLEDE